MSSDDIRAIIVAAQAKADRDVAQGIADLEAAIATAPEWGHTTHLGASRPSVVPLRASLKGMLAHLHKAYAANHVDEDGAA